MYVPGIMATRCQKPKTFLPTLYHIQRRFLLRCHIQHHPSCRGGFLVEHRPQKGQRPRFSAELMDLLAQGKMADYSLAPIGSNYTFFATVSDGVQGQCRVIYKPERGEAPLWDFPPGTLYKREYAAYLFAEALRAAKRTLDPNGVLNPGVLIDP